MTSPIRLGIIGAGSISLRGILPHLSQPDVRDRVVVTAICDPVIERARAAADKFGVAHTYATHGELYASGQVDAVTIASPIGCHHQQGKEAIAHGLHVHFNKTMSTTTAEATELIELAKQRSVKLVASPGEMLRPLYQQIHRLISEGALGIPTWAIAGAAFGQYHEQESVRQGTDVLSNVNPDWYFRSPGGGPLYDMAVYGLHVLTGILGPAKRVTALSGTRIPEREFHGRIIPCNVNDNTLMLLDYGHSLYALIYGVAAGELLNQHVSQPMIFGTRGVISGHLLNGQPIEYPGRVEEAEYSFQPHVVGSHRAMEEAHVYEDIMQLVDWVREDKPSIVTAEHARHVIEIIEAAHRAAETGVTQTLQTAF